MTRGQGDDGSLRAFKRLIEESTRWPYQRSFELPHYRAAPPTIEATRTTRSLRFPSKKMGREIACDSKAEVDFCRQIDRLDTVSAFYEQPDVVRYGRDRRPYHPDFLLWLADQRCVLVEVKQKRDLVLFKNLRKWDALARHCEKKGFGFYIGDAEDSLYRLFRTPILAQLRQDLTTLVQRESITWDQARDVADANGCPQRLLQSAILLSHLVVDNGFVLRLPTEEERSVLVRVQHWMFSVNESPQLLRKGSVRALDPVKLDAARARREARRERRPNNAFKRWTVEEEAFVLRELRRGQDVKAIARSLERTPNAVRIRLERLADPGDEKGIGGSGQ